VDQPVPSRELNGWKEIAAYLGVSEKSAVNYEHQFRLPVHRMPGRKGRVWAFAHELDAWKMGAGVLPAAAPTEKDEAAPFVPGRSRAAYAAAIAIGLVLLAAIGFGVYRHFQPHRAVAKVELRDRLLIARDSEGVELWRHQFWAPFGGLTEKDYENYVQRHAHILPHALAGGARLLFTYFAAEEQSPPHAELFCFSESGAILWHFAPGRTVANSFGQAAPPYSINNVQAIFGNKPDEVWIAVSSNHYLTDANQLAVLDENGKLLGEYWHSGHLTAMAHHDLDGDGVDELLLAGTDNGLRQAVLLVFDPRRVAGANHYTAPNRYQLEGFPPGSEKAIVVFPRTEANTEKFNQIFSLQVTPDRILVPVHESQRNENPWIVYYELDRHLHVVDVQKEPGIAQHYQDLHRAGVLNHDWNDAELQRLKGEVVVERRATVALSAR
jgi:hypothetical protein